MAHLHIECVGGMAGDMFVAALCDAGASVEYLQSQLAGIDFGDRRVSIELGRRDSGFSIHGASFTVRIDGDEVDETNADTGHIVDHHHSDHSSSGAKAPDHADHHHAHHAYADIVATLTDAALDDRVRTRALSVYRALAEAEARSHDMRLDEVHFHEVGAIDAIVDIVSACAALESLGVDTLTVGTVPTGTGFVHTAHGRLPVPVPASAVLLTGFDTEGTSERGEMITPTGAALVAALAGPSAARPAMRVAGVGAGAGRKRWSQRPNLVRVYVGDRRQSAELEPLVELVADIDDQSAEQMADVVTGALESGALDAVLVPTVMKQGRPGTRIEVLCRRDDASHLENEILRHSSSIGVRRRAVERRALERSEKSVSVRGQSISVKLAFGPNGELWNVAPEHRDCRAAAEATGLSTKAVHQLAITAILADSALDFGGGDQ